MMAEACGAFRFILTFSVIWSLFKPYHRKCLNFFHPSTLSHLDTPLSLHSILIIGELSFLLATLSRVSLHSDLILQMK